MEIKAMLAWNRHMIDNRDKLNSVENSRNMSKVRNSIHAYGYCVVSGA